MSVVSGVSMAAPWGRVDPRARLVALVAVECAAFVAAPLVAVPLLVVGIGCLVHRADTMARARLAALLVVGGFAFAAVLNALVIQSGRELMALPLGLALTTDGANAALRMGLRMANLAAFGLAYAYATSTHASAGAIGALLAPLERVVGRRVHTLSFQAEIAIRFVPILAAEAKRVALAQRLRGLDPGRTPLARVRALAPLFVPVFVQAVLHADRLAVLLAARGYRPGMRRRHLRGAAWRPLDSLVVALAAGALLAACLVR